MWTGSKSSELIKTFIANGFSQMWKLVFYFIDKLLQSLTLIVINPDASDCTGSSECQVAVFIDDPVQSRFHGL